MKVGIEAASFYVPHLYLEIEELAKNRDLDSVKLRKGLGLHKMAFPDVHEDAATFAAEALLRLIRDYKIDPKKIDRVYLGTESALDSSKPTATLALKMVEDVLLNQYVEDRLFKNCDALDVVFACVGGVDALQNAVDYVRVNPSKKAVVIASDYAKYELASGGEYTQGGGAVAMLISSKPELLVIDNHWGVGMESVYDFFKPRRTYEAKDLGITKYFSNKIDIFLEEPIFDGQYSNECYKDRIREAYLNFKEEKGISSNAFEKWRYIIFHLPYAFHGKRIFSEIFAIENSLPHSTNEELKIVSGSDEYKKFVVEKIETSQRASSEIGNMYTASIFMALISALQVAYDDGEELRDKEIGFFAYGSGSKSKVFEATVGENWKNIVSKWNLFEALKNRQAIDFSTYEKLHKKELSTSVCANKKGFYLSHIEKENPLLIGARYYAYNDIE